MGVGVGCAKYRSLVADNDELEELRVVAAGLRQRVLTDWSSRLWFRA